MLPCCLLSPWETQGCFRACRWGSDFIRPIGKHCGAPFIPLLQVRSWRSHCTTAVWGGREVAPASPAHSRTLVPCPVGQAVVPEAVPLLQPQILPLLGLLQVRDPQLVMENIESPQIPLHFRKPDAQRVKPPLHCEINGSHRVFWQ